MSGYPTSIPEGGIVTALLSGIDGVLGARDAVGAVIRPVYIVTRTWYSDIGKTTAATQPEGYATDSVTRILPSPGMKQFSQDIRLREGGSVKAGDIILTGISKNSYKESDIDGSTISQNIQKLFLIGDKLYEVINVTQLYVTFNIQVREITNQERY